MKSISFKSLLTILFISIGFNAYGQIHTSSQISEVKNLFYNDSQAWVLVDLDNCLFQAKQAFGHADWFYELIADDINRGLSKQEAVSKNYPAWIESQKICPVQPLEDAFVEIIKDLQSQGFIVMGLTHRQPSVAEATLSQAHSLGINFLESSIYSQTFEIKASHPALFCGGIIVNSL